LNSWQPDNERNKVALATAIDVRMKDNSRNQLWIGGVRHIEAFEALQETLGRPAQVTARTGVFA
jgi:hypothetical protein